MTYTFLTEPLHKYALIRWQQSEETKWTYIRDGEVTRCTVEEADRLVKRDNLFKRDLTN